MASRARLLPFGSLAPAILVVVCAGPLVAARAAAVTQCDQGPTVNPVLLGCAPSADPCIVLSHTAPGGCDLDFGNREVVFQGTFDVGGASLTARARRIAVEGQLNARSDTNQPGGHVALTATGATCDVPGAAGDLVVSGTIDVSGNPGGRLELIATCAIDLGATARLFSKGRLSTSPNVADGGFVSALAGTGLDDAAEVDVRGGSGGAGGRVALTAGATLTIAKPIDATGGEGDGGIIDLAAGDDVAITRVLDVRSRGGGAGGIIGVTAGTDVYGGLVPGGALSVTANLLADGNSDGEGGYDGGVIGLAAFGPVAVAAGARLQAAGGSPDGFGGLLSLSSADLLSGRVTALDGDLTVAGAIDLRAPGDGIGGEVDATAGRDFVLGASADLSGGLGGGDFTVVAGRDLRLDAALLINGRGVEGTGGSLDLRAGMADVGTLTLAASLDATGNSDDDDADLLLSACHLVANPAIVVDAHTNAPAGGGVLDLAARHSMTLASGSQYLAHPGGAITLIHPPAVVPVLGGAVFNPAPLTNTVGLGVLPPCPECGDGVRQPGEPCDNGPGADGACCNADCSALVCATPTATPTITATATGPTPSATPTPTGTPTTTPSPGPPASPTASPTPDIPPVDAKTVAACARTLATASATYALADLTALEACGLRAFTCVQTKADDGERGACLDSVARRCQAKLAKLDRARARFTTRFTDACGGDPPRIPLAVLRSPDLLAFAELEPTCQAETGLLLTSHGAVAACLQLAAACESEHAFAFALPRVGTLLALLPAAGGGGLCLPAPTGDDLGLPDAGTARAAVRCQRILVAGARKLAKRLLSVAARCVPKLLKCRLDDPADACERPAAACAKALAALGDPARGVRAALAAGAERACRGLDAAALGDPAGLGFATVADACAALGEAPTATAGEIAGCVARAYGCAAAAVVGHALPGVETELARVGLALDPAVFCPAP